jgi:hypothetical protein
VEKRAENSSFSENGKKPGSWIKSPRFSPTLSKTSGF